jgi:hypothetical protein
MPTALLPDGRSTYVQNKLQVSVSLPDTQIKSKVEQIIRQGLAEDPRELFVRVQGGGGYGPWCFWIQWGHGHNCCGTSAIILGETERTPEVILSKVQSQLADLHPRAASAAAGTVH